tara:strand:+ start:53 stop:1840 length:1788 start_codon:yes stop_codon:yes gene_type:complete
MAEKIEVGVVIKGADKASADLGKIETKTKGISGGVGEASGALDSMSGGMISMFGKLKQGIKTVIAGFTSLKLAMAGTGIGLLIVAVLSLKAAFTSSEEGQNKFAKIMAVIGSVTDNVIDLFADLGEVIIKAFENPQEAVKKLWEFIKTNFVNRVVGMVEFLPSVGKAIKQALSLDFAGAAKTATDAVAKMTLGIEDFTDKAEKAAEKGKEYLEQVAEEMRLSGDVADMRAKAAKLDRELLVDRSTIQAEIAALRLKSRQEEEFGAEERKKALLDAQVLEEQLLAKEMEALKLRADAQILENTFARSNIENLDKEAAAIAAYNNIQTTRLNAQKSTQRELNRLNKEISASDKQIAKEAETNAAALKKAIQSDAQNEIDVVTAKYIALNELAKGNAEAKAILKDKEEAALLAITKKYAKKEVEVVDTEAAKRIAIEKATADAVRTARLGIVAAGFDALKSMAKTEEGQKRLAISQILVNQGIAMAEAYRGAMQSASGTGPLAAFTAPGFTATMIGMVLSSFASIKGVMNQAGASSGSIGTSSGGGGGGGSTQLALTPTLDSFGEGTLELPAVQAYVLQNNIADADALQQALQNQSSL